MFLALNSLMKNYIKLYDNDPHYIYHAVNVTQVENLPSNSIAELHQRMNQNRSIFQSLQSRETVGNRRTSAHHIHGQQFGLNSVCTRIECVIFSTFHIKLSVMLSVFIVCRVVFLVFNFISSLSLFIFINIM